MSDANWPGFTSALIMSAHWVAFANRAPAHAIAFLYDELREMSRAYDRSSNIVAVWNAICESQAHMTGSEATALNAIFSANQIPLQLTWVEDAEVIPFPLGELSGAWMLGPS